MNTQRFMSQDAFGKCERATRSCILISDSTALTEHEEVDQRGQDQRTSDGTNHNACDGTIAQGLIAAAFMVVGHHERGGATVDLAAPTGHRPGAQFRQTVRVGIVVQNRIGVHPRGGGGAIGVTVAVVLVNSLVRVHVTLHTAQGGVVAVNAKGKLEKSEIEQ